MCNLNPFSNTNISSYSGLVPTLVPQMVAGLVPVGTDMDIHAMREDVPPQVNKSTLFI